MFETNGNNKLIYAIKRFTMPRTLFEKFGHNCEIKPHIRDLPMFHQGSSVFSKWGRAINRMRFISETNRRGYNFLRSQKKIESDHKKHLEFPYVIHPFSDLRNYWECLMLLVILVQIYSAYLNIAMASCQSSTEIYIGQFQIFRLVIDILSGIDIMLNFITGYCDDVQHEVVLNPERIARNYVRGHFLLDVVCSFPIDVILITFNLADDPTVLYNILTHVPACRVIRIHTVFERYYNNISENCNTPFDIYRIVKTMVFFLTYLHLVCCAAILIMDEHVPWNKDYMNTDLFKISYGEDLTTFLKLYTRFFYCVSLLIMNSGYGINIMSTTSGLLTVLVWIWGRLFYTLNVAFSMELQTAVQSSAQKYIDMVSEVNEFMRHKGIPIFLKKRILSYYDIRFQTNYFQESEILNTISGQLRQEILMNTCKTLVESVKFFTGIPLTLLVRIVSCMRYEIFLTNDVIAKVGTAGDCMYFIASGTVAIYMRYDKEVCHLQDGDHFGEIALVQKDTLRTASAVAAEVCELYRLDRREFVRAILPYPDLIEKIMVIVAERLENVELTDDPDPQLLATTKSQMIRFPSYLLK